jgi:hypothetical protein
MVLAPITLLWEFMNNDGKKPLGLVRENIMSNPDPFKKRQDDFLSS